VTGRAAADVLVRFFARRGAPGLRQVSDNRADQARMSAMILAVVGGAAGKDR
jgi:hypothetical protein